MKFRDVAAVLAGVLVLSSTVFAEEAVEYRLPPGIYPLSQSIELRLDPNVADYTGSTTIKIKVDKTADRIGIYQLGLRMNHIVLKGQDGERELTATIGEWNINWLADGKPVAPGDYELQIQFGAAYATDSLGMHRVHFEDNDYVFTQFENMYARRAFPVFDEPAFKIPFQMTIIAPSGMTVIGNTPVASQSESDGWQRVEFLSTPPIPSYLIAYAVGPLDSAPITGLSVPGRIYTPKGRAGEVSFAARETPAILKALESYFGIDYPYRKLDFLAVPEFAFGAMENPGLVTYRTDLLMVGDAPTGSRAASVLSVIAHELAHQWYGNLVTMRWWDDMWLNESFASWMGEKVMESLYPQYETDLGLPQSYAFPTDELSTAKPVRRPVRSEDEAFEDLGLAYTKGETILRMLESYAGPEAFQVAIRDYMKRFSRSNATEHDLWSVVAEHADADIGAIAARYLNQPGFPLVTVDAKGNVSQSRYHRLGRDLPAQQWIIPLSVKYKHDGVIKQTFTLLDKPTGALDIPADAQWVLPDADANGYYRWNIDPAQFQRLVQDMSALSNREKIALLDNSEALLNAGELSLADYMMVLDKALADPHPLVLRPALNALSGIADDFIDPSNAEAFSRFVDHALEGRLEQIGLEARTGESETIAQLRPTLVVVQGRYGSDEAQRKQVIAVADKYLADSDSVSSGLGEAALEIKARFGGPKEYEAYRKAYLGASSETMKSAVLGSMYFSDPEVISENLDWFMTEAVPAGDAIYGIYLASDVLEDNTQVFQWLEKNLDALVAKSPPVRRPYFPALTAACDQQAMQRLVAFYEPRDEVYKPYLAKSVESIENCLARKQREGAALEQFLERYTK